MNKNSSFICLVIRTFFLLLVIISGIKNHDPLFQTYDKTLIVLHIVIFLGLIVFALFWCAIYILYSRSKRVKKWIYPSLSNRFFAQPSPLQYSFLMGIIFLVYGFGWLIGRVAYNELSLYPIYHVFAVFNFGVGNLVGVLICQKIFKSRFLSDNLQKPIAS